jgi:hypothetical protein
LFEKCRKLNFPGNYIAALTSFINSLLRSTVFLDF